MQDVGICLQFFIMFVCKEESKFSVSCPLNLKNKILGYVILFVYFL